MRSGHVCRNERSRSLEYAQLFAKLLILAHAALTVSQKNFSASFLVFRKIMQGDLLRQQDIKLF